MIISKIAIIQNKTVVLVLLSPENVTENNFKNLSSGTENNKKLQSEC